MTAHPDLASLARVLGEPSRMHMLSLLMEGRALTAKELAHGTGIEPATATSHLRQLLDLNLVSCQPQGRHKYFRLASAEVARLMETLMVLAPRTQQTETDLPPMHQARLCYDHLAGRLGTFVTRRLKDLEVITPDYQITPQGEVWFLDLGIQLQPLKKSRRKLAYPCLDWSERQDHLAGSLGAALVGHFTGQGWLIQTKHTRLLTLTEQGNEQLQVLFGALPAGVVFQRTGSAEASH
ncbi:ArsR/SmtB family transcription factor [Deinococcus cellulosilyticus]|nr:helix-turn-helix transcriptional regulator [Deinococcus cellulosilyticus]